MENRAQALSHALRKIEEGGTPGCCAHVFWSTGNRHLKPHRNAGTAHKSSEQLGGRGGLEAIAARGPGKLGASGKYKGRVRNTMGHSVGFPDPQNGKLRHNRLPVAHGITRGKARLRTSSSSPRAQPLSPVPGCRFLRVQIDGWIHLKAERAPRTALWV